MLIYFLPLCFLSVSGESISYTVISHATTGEPCITDCIQGKCRTNWEIQKTCTPGTTPAPVYYTAHFYEGYNLCRSKCGNYGYGYNWCIIDDRFRWDYCNPDEDIEYTSLQMTNSGVECKSECKKHGYSFDWCRLHTGEWDYCDPTEQHHIQARTLKGDKCTSFCTAHITGGSKCYGSNNFTESCAPPVTDHRILESNYIELRKKFNLNNLEKCAVRSVSESGKYNASYPGDYLLPMLDVHENQTSPGYQTVNVNNAGNSVYRYTLLRLNTISEPTLPLIVRARITRASLRPLGSQASSDIISSAARRNVMNMGMITDRSDGNDDEVGQLIAYQNGGSNQPYNFAPQTRRGNQDCSNSNESVESVWLLIENGVNSWVRNNGHTVEQTVFVHYDLPSTRPTGFSVVLENYYSDSTKGFRTSYYISNNPKCLIDNADMSVNF